MVEITFTLSVFEAFSQPIASSSQSLESFKEPYTHFVQRIRDDYPHAVEEDDSELSVLPAPTILNRQLSVNALDILDDEANGGHYDYAAFDDSNESAQYFSDEDLFGRLISDFEYFQQGRDHEQEASEEVYWENDMLFVGDWDSDDTLILRCDHVIRTWKERVHRVEEAVAKTGIALPYGVRDDAGLLGRIHATTEDNVRYFDAEDLFEREDTEMLDRRDEGIHWYSEDWDFVLGKEREPCWDQAGMID